MVRRVQMDDRLPVAQINLCQMVFSGRFVFDSCCFREELVAFEARGSLFNGDLWFGCLRVSTCPLPSLPLCEWWTVINSDGQ